MKPLMKKLLNAYKFESEVQYYEMIVESEVNGQFKQAREQFTAMPRVGRKEFCIEMRETLVFAQLSVAKFINLI